MNNKKFSDIVDNVGTDVQDTSSAFETITKRYINQRYFTILRSINWEVLNPAYTFTTTAGTQTQALPEDFGKELYALDTTNGTELAKGDLSELVRAYPDDLTASGTVQRYAIYEDAVQAQPTTAAVASIVSSSASDTTQTVFVRGIATTYEVTEEITLTGTSAATGSVVFSRIKGISKSAATTGAITVSCNSQTMAILPPTINESRYKVMFLHYNPVANITIKMPYIISPAPMSDDDDYPVLDVADLIEIGAKADAWRYKRQFQKAQDMELLFERELQRYIWEKENDPNKITQFTPTTYDKSSLY